MYGLMLALFICSICYYVFAGFEFMVMFLQAISDNPYAKTKTFSWGHILLIGTNIFVTVVTVMYCFGGVR